MTYEITMKDTNRLSRILNAVGDEARRSLHAVAANAVAAEVSRHIRSYAGEKHDTARRLGAGFTHHYEEGAAAVSASATPDQGEVTIPIPGISRAWHDLDIRPGDGKKFLTIPKTMEAYGNRVSRVRSHGFTIFRPGKAKVLLGYHAKDEKPKLFYALAESVHQRRDPSLLPTQDEIAALAGRAIVTEIKRIVGISRRTGK